MNQLLRTPVSPALQVFKDSKKLNRVNFSVRVHDIDDITLLSLGYQNNNNVLNLKLREVGLNEFENRENECLNSKAMHSKLENETSKTL